MSIRRPQWFLLDRDGTINVGAPHPDYITRPDQLALLDGAGAAIARLNALGLPVAVVTNQRGVARGLMSADDLEAVNAELERLLAEDGARIDLLLSCRHERDECTCRKPLPGLLVQAARELGQDLEEAVMIGDSETDVEAGRAAGTATILLAEPGTPTAADAVARSLWEATELCLGPADAD